MAPGAVRAVSTQSPPRWRRAPELQINALCVAAVFTSSMLLQSKPMPRPLTTLLRLPRTLSPGLSRRRCRLHSVAGRLQIAE
jgi:hypothetical protein